MANTDFFKGSIQSIDISLHDYLITDFWVKSLIKKYNG